MYTAKADIRLTWDTIFPAPYESIWSVIVKVVVLNNLTLGELTKLIQRRDLPQQPVRAIDCSATEWIDYDLFASLLGVDAKRLRRGTWQGLGISPRAKSRYSLRRCPQCWERGYHCVLFDIDVLEACPWHRCQLTPHCLGCTAPSNFALRRSAGLINQRFCFNCGLRFPDRDQIIRMIQVGPITPEVLEESCGSVIDWWHSIGNQFPDRDLLLSEIFWIGQGVEQLACYRSYQLGKATDLAGPLDASWKFSVNPKPVRHSVLVAAWPERNAWERHKTDRMPRIQDLVGKYYRSVRKHLYNTYVRKHVRCYRQLKEVSRYESFGLNGDCVCLPSLAFLIWRMSIEGVTRVEALHFHRRENFALRLMGPRAFYELPLEASIRWSYFGFFGIWNQLEAHRKVLNTKFRVAMSSSGCEGYLHWRCSDTTVAQNIDNGETNQARFAILYPDMASSVEPNWADCCSRHARRQSMLDPSYTDPEIEWDGPQDDFPFRNCLFQVRFPDRERTNNRFDYIHV